MRIRPPLAQLGEAGSPIHVLPVSPTAVVVRTAPVPGAPAHAFVAPNRSCSIPSVVRVGSEAHRIPPGKQQKSASALVATRQESRQQDTSAFRRTVSSGPVSAAQRTPSPTVRSSNKIFEEGFNFDVVYSADVSQHEVYEETALPSVDAAIAAHMSELRLHNTKKRQLNCAPSSSEETSRKALCHGRASLHTPRELAPVCVMCYGPTGSGKTHSMVGEWPAVEHPYATFGMQSCGADVSVYSPAQPGILPRVVASLLASVLPRPTGSPSTSFAHPQMQHLGTTAALKFHRTSRDDDDHDAVKDFTHSLTLHCLEVYLDEVRDLLKGADSSSNVQVLAKDPSSVEALCSASCGVPISSMQQLQAVHRTLTNLRVTTSNKRNDVSSRSHCLLILRLSSSSSTCQSAGAEILLSHVVLVDLAGSERVKQSQVSGVALQEAQAINASLSALCSVVYALHAGAQHIPYRDSRLTRLLKPCFEGVRLVCLVHVGPSAETALEAIATLRFAERLKETCLARAADAKSSIAETASRSGIHREQELHADVNRLSTTLNELTAELRLANETVGYVVRRVARLPLPAGNGRFPNIMAVKMEALEDATLGARLVRETVGAKISDMQVSVTALESALRAFSFQAESEARLLDQRILELRETYRGAEHDALAHCRALRSKKNNLAQAAALLMSRIHVCSKHEDALQRELDELLPEGSRQLGSNLESGDAKSLDSSGALAVGCVQRDREKLLLRCEEGTRQAAGTMLQQLHRLAELRHRHADLQLCTLAQERVAVELAAELQAVQGKMDRLPQEAVHTSSRDWRLPLVLSNGDFISFE